MANRKEEEKTLVYVLQFPNPFEKKNEAFLAKPKLVSEAREEFLRIYKTTLGDEDKDTIPKICENKILWLKDSYQEGAEENKFYTRDLIIAVMSSVLYSISTELNMSYELLSSRDLDEVFVKISVTESWLKQQAMDTEYNLMFKRKDKHKQDFMKISPCGPITLLEKVGNKALFKNYDKEDEEIEKNGSMFTYSDKARLVIDALNSRLDLTSMKKYGILLDNFCMHQEKPLRKLKYTWARLGAIFRFQPLDDIRLYFSEKVALYFAWIGVYSSFMLIAALLGICFQVLELFIEKYSTLYNILIMLFAIFLTFWASVFDQFWIRKEKTLAWQWGTHNFSEVEMQRGDFNGKFMHDEVTGTMKVIDTNGFLNKIRKFLSYSSILMLVFCVIGAVVSIITFRSYMMGVDRTWGRIVPGLMNAFQIKIMNIIYDKVAVMLNNWENHETESQYNDHIAVKLFLFRFVNSYSSLFYLAFFADADTCKGKCIEELGIQLFMIFVTNLFMNIVELGMPWAKIHWNIRSEDKKMEKMRLQQLKDLKEIKDPKLTGIAIKEIREYMYPVEREAKLTEYESPLGDYMEMVIQFGYVSLFGSSLPILPLLAFIEILLEIRVDAWKLCELTKRPNPNRAEDIGVWRSIIIAVAYAGALTNSWIIFNTIGLLENESKIYQILGFIILEHLMILGMYIISLIIPDVPTVVRKGITWSNRKVLEKRLFRKAKGHVAAEVSISKGNEHFWIESDDFRNIKD